MRPGHGVINGDNDSRKILEGDAQEDIHHHVTNHQTNRDRAQTTVHTNSLEAKARARRAHAPQGLGLIHQTLIFKRAHVSVHVAIVGCYSASLGA